MELTYTKQGEYLLPDLTLENQPTLGKYAIQRREYLKENKRPLYLTMQASGQLMPHLMRVQEQAGEMMRNLTTQMAQKQGVTESLKARDPMAWTRRMNNIRQAAEEVIFSDVICC